MGPSIPVGVRLPLATPALPPEDLVTLCRGALQLGFTSFWAGDHVLLPAESGSVYPHTDDGRRPFSADTPWADPLLLLTWLSGQLPRGTRFGTSVMILTLRNPALVAKQLSTLSWLTGGGFSFGVGTGWLRDEYDALGATFEGRARAAKQSIAAIRELLDRGGKDYTVRDEDESPVSKHFTMLPRSSGRVEFLWGGLSPTAMRLIATSCDGWIPAKQSLSDLAESTARLRRACADAGRDFAELRLVAKPGSGPDPASGAIDADTLERYATLGFSEAVLEMPLEPSGLAEALQTIEIVSKRSGLR